MSAFRVLKTRIFSTAGGLVSSSIAASPNRETQSSQRLLMPNHQMAILFGFCLISPALAVEPKLTPGAIFEYDIRGKSVVQEYIGEEGNGNHTFKIDEKKFLLASNMSTITTASGTKVKPHNGQLMLDGSKKAGKSQVGVIWTANYSVTKRGKTSKKKRSCSVDEYTQKKVRAGTFDAYLVRCSIVTVGKSGKSHTATWYDAQSLRVLVHSSGKKKRKLKKKFELVKIKRVGSN